MAKLSETGTPFLDRGSIRGIEVRELISFTKTMFSALRGDSPDICRYESRRAQLARLWQMADRVVSGYRRLGTDTCR